MDLAIVSGISSGLGRAVWDEALAQKMAVLGISRRLVPNSQSLTKSLSLDLGDQRPWEQDLDAALDAWDCSWETIYLITAAGQLGPVRPLEDMPWAELREVYELNTIAPLRMTAWALKRFGKNPCRIRVAHISSGAATKVYAGWTAYASSKAALRMATQVAAAERDRSRADVSYVSYSPGVLDTPMQDQVRRSDADVFLNLPRFTELHRTGQLVRPQDAASILWKLLRAKSLPMYLEYRYGDPWPLPSSNE
jgi:benzil reductase ((S)-benzoin forming)